MATGVIGKYPKPWKLLWTNSSPLNETGKSAFTVSVDLSAYDCVLVDYLANLGRNRHSLAFCPKGNTTILIGQVAGDATSVRTRSASVSDSGVSFSGGYNGASISNTSIIPFAIYGGKIFDSVAVLSI